MKAGYKPGELSPLQSWSLLSACHLLCPHVCVKQ
uniref:Uncharacterized protein n=1 Tax=Anguilla anguilla TaxID=7936 RepID=A0A0E9S5P5_ANGAN